MPIPTQQDIAKSVDEVRLWKPGAAVITDLARFMHFAAVGAEGDKVKNLYEKFADDCKQDVDKAKVCYQGPMMLAPRNAEQFLGNAKREVQTLEDRKIQSYECSSFSYSAIAELLLNDNIRQHYDILQAGTMQMYSNLGAGLIYAHNIAVLVPKGKGANIKLKTPLMGYKNDNDVLPSNALIVDPWARSLGNPAKSCLGVSTREFTYNVTLYPLVFNYNSANEKNLEETVREFRQDNPDFEQRRAAAFAKIEIFGEEKPKASALASLSVVNSLAQNQKKDSPAEQVAPPSLAPSFGSSNS